MQVEIKIDDAYKKPKVIIMTDSMTEALNSILKKLSDSPPHVLSGIRDGKVEILEHEDIIRIYGTGFASSSVIWEAERWNIAQQTGIYFLVVSAVMLPIAYFTYWMEHSIKGFISYLAIFVLIFIGMWIIQFIIAKRNVDKINSKMRNAKH